MTTTAAEYRQMAQERRERSAESFERCDTDGFLSQWASDLTAQQYDLQADILDNGGRSTFIGLYEGERRVKARFITTQYGTSWLLHEDETDLIQRRGKKFLPTGDNSRVHKKLGLSEEWELDFAKADIVGGGTGLAGAASCRVAAVRSHEADRWGGTAILPKE